MKRGKKAQGLKPLSSKISLMLSKSDKSSKTAAKTIILLMLLTLLSFFFLSLAKAPTWVLTQTQSEFNEGNYTNVSSNSTGVVKFIRELPNDQSDESASGGANMTGNVLLMHFNNDTSVGDNTTWTYDYSGNGNNGTFKGAGEPAWTTSGKFGSALEFDGVDDYIAVDSLASTSQTYTFSMWVKSSAPDTQYDYLFSSTPPYLIFAWNTDTVGQLGFYDGSFHDFGNTPNDGNWHHLALILDSSLGNGTLYLDGTQFGSTQSYTGMNISGTVTLGNQRIDGAEFNGTIDEVAIWNRSLSADEILQHYLRTNATHGTYESKVYDANRTVSWENMSWTQGVPYQEELPHDQTDEKDAGIVGGANMSGNVLLMHFNNDSAYGENNTRAYDFSGNGNNGTAVDNAAPTSAGKFNGAFTFDGSGDYIDCGNDSSLDITGEITISVWVFAKDTSINPILEKSNAYSTGEGYNNLLL